MPTFFNNHQITKNIMNYEELRKITKKYNELRRITKKYWNYEMMYYNIIKGRDWYDKN